MKQWRGERLNLLLGVLAVLFAGVSAHQALRANRLNREIAARSGAFDKAGFELRIGHVLLRSGEEGRVLIGQDPDPELIAPVAAVGLLPISILSTGEKTIEDVNLTVQFPGAWRRDLLKETEDEVVGHLDERPVMTDEAQVGDRFVSYLRVPQIHPGGGFLYPIQVLYGAFSQDRPFWVGDRASPTIVNQSEPILLTVSAKHVGSITYRLSIRGVTASSMANLKAEAVAQVVVPEAEEFRDSRSFLSYLISLMRGFSEKSYILIFTPTEHHTLAGDREIYFYKYHQTSVSMLYYKPAGWRGLFQ